MHTHMYIHTYTHMSVCVWVYAHEYRFPQRSRMAFDPLEWNTQAVVSCIIWELNSAPLQEQHALLTASPPLRSSKMKKI